MIDPSGCYWPRRCDRASSTDSPACRRSPSNSVTGKRNHHNAHPRCAAGRGYATSGRAPRATGCDQGLQPAGHRQGHRGPGPGRRAQRRPDQDRHRHCEHRVQFPPDRVRRCAGLWRAGNRGRRGHRPVPGESQFRHRRRTPRPKQVDHPLHRTVRRGYTRHGIAGDSVQAATLAQNPQLVKRNGGVGTRYYNTIRAAMGTATDLHSQAVAPTLPPQRDLTAVVKIRTRLGAGKRWAAEPIGGPSVSATRAGPIPIPIGRVGGPASAARRA